MIKDGHLAIRHITRQDLGAVTPANDGCLAAEHNPC